MEYFASDIASFLPSSAPLRSVSTTTRSSMIQNDKAILEGIRRKYPSTGTIEGAILEAIEKDDLGSIRVLINEYSGIPPVHMDHILMYVDTVSMAQIILPHISLHDGLILIARLNIHGYKKDVVDTLIDRMNILYKWSNTSKTGREHLGYINNIITLISEVFRYNYTDIPSHIRDDPGIVETFKEEIRVNERRRLDDDPVDIGYVEPPILPIHSNIYRLRFLGLDPYADVLLKDTPGVIPVDQENLVDILRYDDINIFKSMIGNTQSIDYPYVFLYTKYNRVMQAMIDSQDEFIRKSLDGDINERFLYLIVRYSKNSYTRMYALMHAAEEGYTPILAKYVIKENIVGIISLIGREYDPSVRSLFKRMGLNPDRFDHVFDGDDQTELWKDVLLNAVKYNASDNVRYLLTLYKDRISSEFLTEIIQEFTQEGFHSILQFVSILPMNRLNQEGYALMNKFAQS